MSKELDVVFDVFRSTAKSEREKGEYFEEIVQIFLQNEINKI